MIYEYVADSLPELPSDARQQDNATEVRAEDEFHGEPPSREQIVN